MNDVCYSQIRNEAKRDIRLACDQRKVNKTLFKSNAFQMNFKFTDIYFWFSKSFRIRILEQDYLKKDCCVRQSKVIERIIEHYWY